MQRSGSWEELGDEIKLKGFRQEKAR